jgi:hypothetical protein
MASTWLRDNVLVEGRTVVSTCAGEWWIRLGTGVGIVTTGGCSSSFLFIMDYVAQRYQCFLMGCITSGEQMERLVAVLETHGGDYVAGIGAILPDFVHFRLEYQDFFTGFMQDGALFFNGCNWQFLVIRDGYEACGCIIPDGDTVWIMCLVSCLRALPLGNEETPLSRPWMSVVTTQVVFANDLLERIRGTDWSNPRLSWRTIFPMKPTDLTVWEQVLEVKYFGEWLSDVRSALNS